MQEFFVWLVCVPIALESYGIWIKCLVMHYTGGTHAFCVDQWHRPRHAGSRSAETTKWCISYVLFVKEGGRPSLGPKICSEIEMGLTGGSKPLAS